MLGADLICFQVSDSASVGESDIAFLVLRVACISRLIIHHLASNDF
jgi:hypothetical protein